MADLCAYPVASGPDDVDRSANCMLERDHDGEHDPKLAVALTALDRWYARHQGRTDHPRVQVWWPRSLPNARLATIGGGCGQPDTLPDGPPTVYLTIGGVEIGGQLEDIELLMAASTEVVQFAREQYETMRAAEQPDPPPVAERQRWQRIRPGAR